MGRRFPKIAVGVLALLLLVGTAHASTGGVTLSGPNSGITVPTWEDFTELVERVEQLEEQVAALQGDSSDEGDDGGSDDGGSDDDDGDAGDGDASDGESGAEPPEAEYSYTPQAPDADETVTFDAGESRCDAARCDYAWHDVIHGGEWDLGTGEVLEFTFAGAGDKHVRLTVIDDDGREDSTTQIVTVNEPEDEDDGSHGDGDGGGDEPSVPDDSDEPTDGGLREGFGGTARPSGDEYAIPAGYPHGGNTGFAASDLDESDLEDVGTLRLDTPGETVSGVRARRVEVNADNVTLTDSIVEGSSLYAVDAFRSGQTGFTMERVDVHQTDECRKGLYARNATFDNVNAWGGDTVAVFRSDVTVRNSFIHDPSDDCPDRHYDAVHTQGAESLHIEGSTLLTRYQDQTAALIAQSNQSELDDLRLTDSFVAGGTYTVYVRERNHGRPTNVVVTDNLWQAGAWQFGPVSLNRHDSWTWSGNRDTEGNSVD